MAAHDGLSMTDGGFHTTRLISSQADEESHRLAARDAAARRTLAAFALDACPSVDDDVSAAREWYVEMADMLGLGLGPARPPGLCVICDRPVPAASSARAQSGQVRRDLCGRRACNRMVLHG